MYHFETLVELTISVTGLPNKFTFLGLGRGAANRHNKD